MAKKLFGLSMFLWILLALVVLFFVYDVGRREGFYGVVQNTCASRTNQSSCTNLTGCSWNGDSVKSKKGDSYVISNQYGTCTGTPSS